jgi:mRNA-degrading endonuclease toxin of MazEF toxin-antitoxin module
MKKTTEKKYRQGDIVHCSFPYAENPHQTKKRFGVIVSNFSGDWHKEYFIVRIGTTLFDDGFDIPITEKSVTVPLKQKSFIRTASIQTITDGEILGAISELKPEFLKEVIEKVKALIEVK